MNKPDGTPYTFQMEGDKAIAEASAKLDSLRKERADRDSGDHPDYRVPGEIGKELRSIGMLRAAMLQQKANQLAMIEENAIRIGVIDSLTAGLVGEMEYATGCQLFDLQRPCVLKPAEYSKEALEAALAETMRCHTCGKTGKVAEYTDGVCKSCWELAEGRSFPQGTAPTPSWTKPEPEVAPQ